MSRRRVCYWPGKTNAGREWTLLNLDASDDDILNTAFCNPSPSRSGSPRYSPRACYSPTRVSPTPSACYCISSSTRVSTTPSVCCCTYTRPWRYTPPAKSGFSKIQHDKDAFKVTLDVKHFKDGDLKVKVVGNQVVVEAQHDEREDEFGYISRRLKRKYELPGNVDAENVKTELSSDGILTIVAPRKVDRVEGGTERLIPILKTNKPALTTKRDDTRATPATPASGEQDDEDDDDDDDDDA